eukprot:gene772-858_t
MKLLSESAMRESRLTRELLEKSNFLDNLTGETGKTRGPITDTNKGNLNVISDVNSAKSCDTRVPKEEGEVAEQTEIVSSYSKVDELRYLRQENGWLKHHHQYDRSTMFRQDELLRNTEGTVGTRDRPVGPEPTRLRFDLESAHKERAHWQPASEGRPAPTGSLTHAEESMCGAHGLEGGRPNWARHEVPPALATSSPRLARDWPHTTISEVILDQSHIHSIALHERKARQTVIIGIHLRHYDGNSHERPEIDSNFDRVALLALDEIHSKIYAKGDNSSESGRLDSSVEALECLVLVAADRAHSVQAVIAHAETLRCEARIVPKNMSADPTMKYKNAFYIENGPWARSILSLSDWYMVSHSDYFIGTWQSSFSFLIGSLVAARAALRGGPEYNPFLYLMANKNPAENSETKILPHWRLITKR